MIRSIIIVAVLVLIAQNTCAQKISILFTQLNQKDSIQYLNFQGETHFTVSDTLVVELNDQFERFGVMTLKLKEGYLLCDFSSFYGLKDTKQEPIEFRLYKISETEYRASVFNMRGADIFWECRYLTNINIVR